MLYQHFLAFFSHYTEMVFCLLQTALTGRSAVRQVEWPVIVSMCVLVTWPTCRMILSAARHISVLLLRAMTFHNRAPVSISTVQYVSCCTH